MPGLGKIYADGGKSCSLCCVTTLSSMLQTGSTASRVRIDDAYALKTVHVFKGSIRVWMGVKNKVQ